MAQIYRLTAKDIDAQKARGRLADGGGLFLQVTDWKGVLSRSWEFRFTLHGKTRSMGLLNQFVATNCATRFSASVAATFEQPERASDEEIIERGKAAANGDKFAELWAGRWDSLYSSQSEADFAFVDMRPCLAKGRSKMARTRRLSDERPKSLWFDAMQQYAPEDTAAMTHAVDVGKGVDQIETGMRKLKAASYVEPLSDRVRATYVDPNAPLAAPPEAAE